MVLDKQKDIIRNTHKKMMDSKMYIYTIVVMNRNYHNVGSLYA